VPYAAAITKHRHPDGPPIFSLFFLRYKDCPAVILCRSIRHPDHPLIFSVFFLRYPDCPTVILCRSLRHPDGPLIFLNSSTVIRLPCGYFYSSAVIRTTVRISLFMLFPPTFRSDICTRLPESGSLSCTISRTADFGFSLIKSYRYHNCPLMYI
jgi:hypothetical protein